MGKEILKFLEPYSEKFSNVLVAIGVFIVGWLISKILEKTMNALLKRSGIDEWVNKKTKDVSVKIEPIISKLVYYLLLIYTLLLTLDILQVRNVLTPVSNMFAEFIGMIPNIVAAGFIAFVGYVLAKIVSTIVQAASSSLDPIAPNAGLGKSTSISRLLSQLVFIIIFIPIMVASLDALKIPAISDPAKALIGTLTNSLPYIIGAGIILLVAYVGGKLLTRFIAELLHNMGADDIPEKIGAKDIFGEKKFSQFCGALVFFFIMLAAAMSAVNTLQLANLSAILNKLLEFSGNVVLGLIILAIGNLIANFAQKKMESSTKSVILPLVVRFTILFLVIAMGLHTMGVAQHIIEMTFMFTLATLSLTIILAFGIGGREPASKIMSKWLEKLQK
jgi:hypothetical protein